MDGQMDGCFTVPQEKICIESTHGNKKENSDSGLTRTQNSKYNK